MSVRLFRSGRCQLFLLAIAWGVTIPACQGASSESSTSAPSNDAATDPADSWLHDVTEEWGVEFEHTVGRFTDFEMPAIMGSGCAIVDYDRDGRLDIYLVNGTPHENSPNADRGDAFFRQLPGQIYSQLDIETGIEENGFGMGAWWADYDADGFPDLFLTNVGHNQLYQNQGDGTFRAVALPAGVAQSAWSTAACWADVNADQWLDLFVANYVDYLPGQYCEGTGGLHEFCGPSAYPGTVDQLLLNRAEIAPTDGVPFKDETVQWGLGDLVGKGLGILAQDLTADGLTDLYVANDMESNFLWIQNSDGRFENLADVAGVSRNFLGELEASMGVVSGDWNQDGLRDLFMTHLAGETNTIYLSLGAGLWRDSTVISGLGPTSLPATSFGIAQIDFRNDGYEDLLIANGGVKRGSEMVQSEDPRVAYQQQNSIYLQRSESHQFEVADQIGGMFTSQSKISRAMARGDLDRDGDLDLVLTNCAGTADVYENNAPDQGHWLCVRLIDQSGNRDAIGAKLEVRLKGRKLIRTISPYEGYLSSSDVTAHVGIGAEREYDSLIVTWPDGQSEEYPSGPGDQHLCIVRGQGVFRLEHQASSVTESQTSRVGSL